MADEADIANDYIDREVLHALDKMRQNPTAQLGPKMGSKVCRECGENIPDGRRKLGFQLCIECAEETERRKSMFADY